MIDASKLKAHVVFPASFTGDVLIVTPAGDSMGFRERDVADEMARLIQFTEEPEVQHLVVDFSQSNYFGSTIVGAVNAMATRVRDRGGQFAICNASADMLGILQVMNILDHWPHYPSLKKALKAIR